MPKEMGGALLGVRSPCIFCGLALFRCLPWSRAQTAPPVLAVHSLLGHCRRQAGLVQIPVLSFTISVAVGDPAVGKGEIKKWRGRWKPCPSSAWQRRTQRGWVTTHSPLSPGSPSASALKSSTIAGTSTQTLLSGRLPGKEHQGRGTSELLCLSLFFCRWRDGRGVSDHLPTVCPRKPPVCAGPARAQTCRCHDATGGLHCASPRVLPQRWLFPVALGSFFVSTLWVGASHSL